MGRIMSVEYYIVKPNKKQLFYLGKRISYLEGIVNNQHEPEYASYETYEDVWLDIFLNSHYFLEGDYELEQINNFCYQIFEFCDDKVYLDNDCNDQKIWDESWEEIDLFDTLESRIEKWLELIYLIPQDEWVTETRQDVKVVDEFQTVKKYIEKLGESEK